MSFKFEDKCAIFGYLKRKSTINLKKSACISASEFGFRPGLLQKALEGEGRSTGNYSPKVE